MAASLLLLARQISPPTVADGELLDRFSRSRDNEAFTELVRRHGPIVYRICRRLVGTGAADDAFQATFLLLATRTSAAKAANSIGGWLAGVAGRVARQIRRAAQRRQNHETKAANHQSVEPADSTPELLDQFRILDEELTRLPDRLRDPLVSCLLQGHTQEEAAAESGQTARTVRRRLDEAKRLLRIRLQRRGVTPAVALGLVAGLSSVTTAIPVGLEARTVDVVFDFLNGGSVLASPPVLLAKGVASTMFARKVMAAMVAMALGLTGLGFVLAEAPPSQPPEVQEVKGPINTRQDVIEKQIKPTTHNLNAGEKQLLIEAMIVEMPAKFCDESGLTVAHKWDEETALLLTCLNRREVKMLHSLIRINPERQGISRPLLTVRDGETCYAQMGGEYPVLTDFQKTLEDAVKARSIKMIPYGYALAVTPKVNKDDGNILLRIETRAAQVSTHVVVPEIPSPPRDQSGALSDKNFLEQDYNKEFDAGSGLPKGSTGIQTSPSFHTRSVHTSLIIPPGGTVVIASKSESGSKPTELLWILTAHVGPVKQ
ncbi:MAG TPA: sigma-70 family RNA polymerase sigma factor [Gemmata sp.]|nr:sigma-70 family RNA polymerase sigma factor [Gemmata sp.]